MSLAERTAAALAGVEGTVRPVVTAPDAVLSRPSEPVDPADTKIIELAADLLATMRVGPGCVGLAAPQLGLGLQVFAVDVAGHPKTVTSHGAFVLCNAEIEQATRWKVGREGCMSVPDLTGDVKRAGRLVVTGQLPGSGERVSITTDAFEARAIQHEIDHCAGLLFLDRVAGAHAVHRRKVYL
ncbi:MAG TPA: peptide deformylase [Natronosporangium sp.]